MGGYKQIEEGFFANNPTEGGNNRIFKTIRTSKVAQNRIQKKDNLERGQTPMRKYLRTLTRTNQVIKDQFGRGQNQAPDTILRVFVRFTTEMTL